MSAISQIINDAKPFQIEEPFPLYRINQEANDFPIGALPQLLKNAVLAIHHKTQAPLALCAQSVLSACSLVAQKHVDVELATGEIKPVSNFFLTIGESGERKSTADNLALSAIRRYQGELIEQYKDDFQTWEIEYKAWEATEKKILKQSGKKSTYEIQSELKELGPAPKEPLKPLVICSEPTIEGLLKLFLKGQPSLGLFTDEGGMFLQGHAMNPESKTRTSTYLSKLWDGSPLDRVRSQDGIEVIEGKRLSIHLMIQPEIANDALNDSLFWGQGLFSRVLMSHPQSTMGKRFHKSISQNDVQALENFNSVLYTLLQKDSNGLEPKKPTSLKLAPEANKKCFELSDAIEVELASDGRYRSISGFANKLVEHATRLAAVIFWVSNCRTETLNEIQIEQAFKIAEYYAQEALRLKDQGSINKTLKQAKSVLEWIHSLDAEKFPLSLVYQKGPNFVRNKAQALKIIRILLDHGYLESIEGGCEIDGIFRKEAYQVTQKISNFSKD